MRTVFPACLLVIVLLSALFPPPLRAQSQDALVFGLIATASPKTVLTQWEPLLADLGQSLGRPVRPQVFTDYAGVVWAMAAGHVHMAWLGNKSAIEAVDRAGGEVALQALNNDGHAAYHSVLLARVGSGLGTVEDMFARASELAYGDGDVNSTSGHVIPDFYLFSRRGLEPRAIFRRVAQNNHEDNFLAVADGRLDVATGNTVNLARSTALHPEAASRVAVIWTSPPIPGDPLVWRAELDARTKASVRDFFVGYGRAAPDKTQDALAREQAALAAMERGGFKASDNNQLREVRRIELHQRRNRLLSDLGLPQEERLRRLEDIDAAMRALGGDAP
jgi:phosphonate transport system substrate-binding protein